MSLDQIQLLLESTFSGWIWNNVALTSYSDTLINKLSKRNTEKSLKLDWEHFAPLPKIAIEGMINRIKQMPFIDQSNGAIGRPSVKNEGVWDIGREIFTF